mmetsp:Transcript_37678/g.46652  ORF Transcript_37678/g.46652 Transcript_37678/m.46652 type:complete len:112 (+) Transcript_37678:42-377(+)
MVILKIGHLNDGLDLPDQLPRLGSNFFMPALKLAGRFQELLQLEVVVVYCPDLGNSNQVMEVRIHPVIKRARTVCRVVFNAPPQKTYLPLSRLERGWRTEIIKIIKAQACP